MLICQNPEAIVSTIKGGWLRAFLLTEQYLTLPQAEQVFILNSISTELEREAGPGWEWRPQKATLKTKNAQNSPNKTGRVARKAKEMEAERLRQEGEGPKGMVGGVNGRYISLTLTSTLKPTLI